MTAGVLASTVSFVALSVTASALASTVSFGSLTVEVACSGLLGSVVAVVLVTLVIMVTTALMDFGSVAGPRSNAAIFLDRVGSGVKVEVVLNGCGLCASVAAAAAVVCLVSVKVRVSNSNVYLTSLIGFGPVASSLPSPSAASYHHHCAETVLDRVVQQAALPHDCAVVVEEVRSTTSQGRRGGNDCHRRPPHSSSPRRRSVALQAVAFLRRVLKPCWAVLLAVVAENGVLRLVAVLDLRCRLVYNMIAMLIFGE